MQHFENLWKAVNVVSSVREIAVETKTYQWDVTPPLTFFLHVEHADVILKRQQAHQISAQIELQGGFGWQLVTDQDHAGVYVVAKRKPVIGSMGRGTFDITLPEDIHVTLKLEHCRLTFDDLHTQVDIPPQSPSITVSQ